MMEAISGYWITLRMNLFKLTTFHFISPTDWFVHQQLVMGSLYTKLFYSAAPSAQPGFDEQFDPPLKEGLKCRCCLLGLREPVQTHCGHRFCRECIEVSIR